MSKFFIHIYDWFEKHRVAFYVILTLLVSICIAMAVQVSFQENITNFFNNSDKKKNATFENVAVKDKIIVMLSGNNPDSIISSAEILPSTLSEMIYSSAFTSGASAILSADTRSSLSAIFIPQIQR